MQSLFAGQLQVLAEALQFHLSQLTDVDTLLAIEVKSGVFLSRADECDDVRGSDERAAITFQR